MAAPRPELLALLTDCKQHPRELGLRLILADWLEENGAALDQPRAELLRCQVGYSQLPPTDVRRITFGQRGRALQVQHGKAWLGPLAAWAQSWACAHGLLALGFTVQSLRSQALTRLADDEAWAWVEQVHFLHAEDHDLAGLAASPLLRGPTSFLFNRSLLSPAGAQALGRSPWLEGAVHLEFGNHRVGRRGLEALLTSPHLTRLEQLELPANDLDADAASVLGRCTSAATIDRLVLWNNRLGDAGTVELAISLVAYPRLRHLDLRGNGIGDAGAGCLANCGHLSELRVLNLADNQIGPDGAASLAASRHLGAIEQLTLWGNPVGAEGARSLEQRFGSRVQVSPVEG